MIQKNNFLSKVGQATAVIAIAVIFFSLGLWQLQRASDLKNSLKVATTIDTNLVDLSSIAKPRQGLEAKAMNKTISTSGDYIAILRAPNQIDGYGKMADWEVGLLQINATSAILVVRGLWSERLSNSEISKSTRINIEGLLVAHQNSERAQNGPGVISRLDSAVVVSLTHLDLYDGYVLAQKESTQAGPINRIRLTAEKLRSRIPGFYWQHLSYVAIWWLMAVVVLYMPFYRRRVTP